MFQQAPIWTWFSISSGSPSGSISTVEIMFVRKYVYLEPAHGDLGSEEEIMWFFRMSPLTLSRWVA